MKINLIWKLKFPIRFFSKDSAFSMYIEHTSYTLSMEPRELLFLYIGKPEIREETCKKCDPYRANTK